ncbi:MAG: hypothetical protein V3V13_06595 [Paracoccaceae bacterium]
MMQDDISQIDARGLIADAYQIEGITLADCRMIFLDWALGIPGDRDMSEPIKQLLNRFAATAPTHPMTSILNDAIERKAIPRVSRRRRV